MKTRRMVGAILIALLLTLVFATAAQAISSSLVNQIIKDAQNGTLDHKYTAAEIRAALNAIKNDPIYAQYSGLQGVLSDYLASLQAPGENNVNNGNNGNGSLAFTGSEVLVLFGAGAALVAGGVLLRRRLAA